MMNGWSSGMDAGAWIFMGLFWLLLVGVVAALALRLFRRSDGPTRDERPQEILDRRLAAGEIGHDEYDRLRATLRRDAAVNGR